MCFNTICFGTDPSQAPMTEWSRLTESLTAQIQTAVVMSCLCFLWLRWRLSMDSDLLPWGKTRKQTHNKTFCWKPHVTSVVMSCVGFCRLRWRLLVDSNSFSSGKAGVQSWNKTNCQLFEFKLSVFISKTNFSQRLSLSLKQNEIPSTQLWNLPLLHTEGLKCWSPELGAERTFARNTGMNAMKNCLS